jgi:transposase InsO family protein
MVKYAGPDKPAETAGTTSPEVNRFSVVRMARLLGVSTSGYYAYVKRAAVTVLTPRRQRRADLAVKILDVHTDSDGTYGSPRITTELRERGEMVNEKTVAAIMAEIGIEGISPRTFKVRTTVTDPTASFPPDRVRRCFDQGRLDAVWLTDITYLTCGEGDMYLCAIRDGHSRRVLGHVVADHIGADMVCLAIDAAVVCRGGRVAGTVLHSDRGGEFTAVLTVQAWPAPGRSATPAQGRIPASAWSPAGPAAALRAALPRCAAPTTALPPQQLPARHLAASTTGPVAVTVR